MVINSEIYKNLLQITPRGLFCPAGGFFIDPWDKVPRAVITHSHSDHARWGCEHYLAATSSASLLRHRLGNQIDLQSLEYGELLRMGDATISLHPAGHILGSAQVRIEVAGQVALITGDYKLQADPTCSAWEPQRCDLLVTESTFGLPVFRWPSTEQVIDEIAGWWQENQLAGRTSVLLAYSVGKSQRIIAELLKKLGSEAAHEMAVHGALRGPNRAYVAAGVVLPDLPSAASMPSDHDWSRSLILAPPSSQSTPWMQRFSDPSIAMASGWMAIRGTRRRRGVERGFILSDHIDWPDLLQAIGVCKPQQVWVTHGFTDIVARFLAEQGIPACVLETKFQGDDAEGTQESEQAPESAP